MSLLGLLPIVGGGLQLLGGLFGGKSQSGANKEAQQYQLQRNQMIDDLVNRYLSQNAATSPTQGFLQGFLGSQFTPARGATAAVAPAPGDVQAPSVDLGTIFNAGDFNQGQDALLQFLRSDPTRQLLGGIDLTGQLGGILANGGQQSTDAALSALDRLQQQDTQKQLALLQGSSGSLGQRFGTATQQRAADLLSQLSTQYGAQRAQLALGAAENAQNRRLQAGQTLAGLAGQQGSQALQAAQLLQFAPQLAAQVGLANQDAALRAALANQQAGLSTSQFNAGQANQIGQFNAEQANNFFLQQLAQRLQGAQIAGALGGQQAGTNVDLLRIMAGLGTPGANTAAGYAGNSLAQAGQFLGLYPFMKKLFGG